MKQITVFIVLVVAFVAVGAVGTDAADKRALKAAAERSFSSSKPVKGPHYVRDSMGCLWGLGEDNGKTSVVKIIDQSGNQYCGHIHGVAADVVHM